MATPSSQKADVRPISFALLQNGNVVAGTFFNLIIRPEDLTNPEPTRTTVSQALGGGWLDNFGLGIKTVQIAGHTGWVGAQQYYGMDGFALFKQLRDDIFRQWHTLRAAALAQGKDPDQTVEMLYIDTLNDIVGVVAPIAPFVLRRSRARPLLCMYSMQMAILRPVTDQLPQAAWELLAPDNPQLPSAQVKANAITALQNTINGRADLAAQIRDTFAPANRVLADVMDASTSVLTQVKSATEDGIDAFDAVTAPLIAASSSIEHAAMTLSQCLVEPLALTETIKSTLRDAYGSFGEAYCNLLNNFAAVGQYLDFSGLFGAFNCSSTTGGRPQSAWSNDNPFLSMYPPAAPPGGMTTDAQDALNEVNGQDPLTLNAQSLDYKLSLLQRLANGIPH